MSVYFITHLPMGALHCEALENLPGVCGCLKFTATPRDLFVCVGYRDDGSHSTMMLRTFIAHRVHATYYVTFSAHFIFGKENLMSKPPKTWPLLFPIDTVQYSQSQIRVLLSPWKLKDGQRSAVVINARSRTVLRQV
jgi:hypothetical protein